MSKTMSSPTLPIAPVGHERDGRHDWSGVMEAIRRYALARRKQDDIAEDIAQETVLRCIEYCRSHDVASLYALAYRIAANLIADHHRAARGQTGELEESIECDAPLPDQIVADRLEIERLSGALSGMPALRREVFLRRRLHGESYATITKDLNMSSKAVEKHIGRALETLTKAMKRSSGSKRDGS
ncbi:RNA polymerase sigma factor [Novosphingobium mangrovi (ex Huang et al. 2023)]|uniref:Sigma-70 family RNA polymerase sigma factor n=1 Tax=Novosphingobium mangrovi (ex Huang et al. 2023) TaxID=2976432 RepID=A0ABT2I8R3_9SPHN|nr:sigma-70 family RNA polymerase sigma factor [Novosphingobium mangrovi (ex Huang et al. 2023)]MCT2401164.1 sigma-70 family RNA polymerase sigma factor [Novosphingobium mangrovi (ex Huang et al. 2023)]